MFKYRVAYFSALVASAAFYLFYSGYLSFFTAALVLLLPLISRGMTMFAVRNTSVRFEVQKPCVEKGENIVLDIVYRNRSVFPLAQAGLKFRCTNSLCGETRRDSFFMPVGSHTEQTAQYAMKSKYCGKIVMELDSVKYYDYLGIFSLTKKPEVQAQAFVLPKTRQLDTGIDSAVNFSSESSTYSTEKPGDDPSEIFDVRPYRSGDRLRSIHWKLSTKTDDLMVKEFSMPTDNSVLLLAELMAPSMESLDRILEVLASLSLFLRENRISHCVEWYDERQNRILKANIQSEEDSAELLSAVLSAKKYQNAPLALLAWSRLNGITRDCPHIIYLTGLLNAEITGFCDHPAGDKMTVLFCGVMDEQQKRLAGSIGETKIRVIQINPEKIAESLSGFLL